MKCPIDGTEMEIGTLLSNKGAVPFWAPKDSKTTRFFNFGNLTYGHPKVWAYKCPKCGKVELKVDKDGETK